jgi:Cof subfamily protein (haloacid dehalogenase superfamily)
MPAPEIPAPEAGSPGTGSPGSARSGRPAARPGAPKLIVSDLDGTFLSADGSVSDENSAAVLAAQAAGVPVLFATGRPVRWLDVIRALPGAHPTVIASNGAVLYDLGSGELLDRVCVDAAVALRAVQELRRVLPGTAFAFESGTRFGYEPTYRTWAVDDGTNEDIFTGSAEQLVCAGAFVKMLVQNLSLAPDALAQRVRDVVADSLTVTHSAGQDNGLVEVSAPGVSKASMLQRVCTRLGVQPEDVAAFGDMPNDLEMLNWVGRPHVVANAHPQLLGLGFTVVPANVDSGVGQTIAEWVR